MATYDRPKIDVRASESQPSTFRNEYGSWWWVIEDPSAIGRLKMAGNVSPRWVIRFRIAHVDHRNIFF